MATKKSDTSQATLLNTGHLDVELHYKQLLGLERLRSEIRLLGGLMVVLGIGAALSTMALIATLVEGMSGSAQVDGFSLPILVGNFLQLVCGMTAVGTGVWAMVHVPLSSLMNSHGGRFHRWMKVAIAVINLGPITFFITIVRLIQGADDPADVQIFIPMSLNPTQADIRMCVAMGVLVLISVCCAIIGGLTLLALNLCADLAGQPHSRHRAYQVIRAAFYNVLVVLGALAQLLLGAYLWGRFGFGPYEEPVHVATFTIFFPIVSVVVGTLQMWMGCFGFCRSVGWCKVGDESDASFLLVVGFVWISSIFLQNLFQPAYAPDPYAYDAEGSTVACVYFGFFLMPVYFDYLIRTTPIQPRPVYYGLPADAYYKEDLLVKWLGMAPPSRNQQRDVAASHDEECGSNDGMVADRRRTLDPRSSTGTALIEASFCSSNL